MDSLLDEITELQKKTQEIGELAVKIIKQNPVLATTSTLQEILFDEAMKYVNMGSHVYCCINNCTDHEMLYVCVNDGQRIIFVSREFFVNGKITDKSKVFELEFNDVLELERWFKPIF